MIDLFRRKKLWFYIFLIAMIKIVFFLVFQHKLINEQFTPFILNNSFYTVYADAYKNGYEFPYPAGMFYIFSLFKFLTMISAKLQFLVPLIIADFIILFSLFKIIPNQKKLTTILYWSSPIVLYATYIHGQLDLLPMAVLLMATEASINKKQQQLVYFLLALAVSIKTSSLLAVPFFLIYTYYKNRNGFELLKNLMIFVTTVICINAPFLKNQEFYQLVLLNQEQAKTWKAFLDFHDLKFYLLPAIYLFLVYYLVHLKIIGKWTFVSFLCFAFGIILCVIPPMPAWPLWVLPFFVIIYSHINRTGIYAYALWTIGYFLHFSLNSQSDIFYIVGINGTPFELLNSFGINAKFLSNLSFTFFQSALLLQLMIVWKRGVLYFKGKKYFNNPYLLGISGNSGAGKTTLAFNVSNLLGKDRVGHLTGDDLHKWKRGDINWEKFTHFNPKANELSNEIYFLNELKKGKPVFRSHYDHSTGTFTELRKIYPKSIIISEGLHTYYLKKVRSYMDLKVYINPEEQLCNHWKIIRDKNKRGYSKDKVIEQITNRLEDYENFILAQEKEADLVITPKAKNKINHIGNEEENINLIYTLTCRNDIDLEPFIEQLNINAESKVVHEYTTNDRQVINTPNIYSNEDLKNILERLVKRVEDFGDFVSERNCTNVAAEALDIPTLFVIYCLHWSIYFDQE